MKLSLMKKMTLSFLFAILGSIILASFISNYMVGKEFNKYLIDEQKVKIDNIINIVEELYSEQNSFSNINHSEIQRYAVLQNLYIEIKDLEDTIIYSSGDSHLYHKIMMQNMMDSPMHNFSERNIGEYTEVSYPLIINNKNIGSIKIGYFETSYLSSASIAFINTLNNSFIISAFIALIFGIVISIIISKQFTKPLIRITKTANEMRNGNLKARALVKTNTKEIDELSGSINYLAESLSNQDMLRKRLTSDMAHELRTPLTTLKTYIEAFIDGIWEPTKDKFESISEEIERLTKLVDNLRNLAKLEQTNLNLNKSNINLSNELIKILDTFKPLYLKKNYELNSNISIGINAFVDKDKFNQIMNNLLLNSYKYLKPNGTVEVILHKEKENIIIKIIDNGIGISKKDLPYIFERLYRSDVSRTKNTGGSGIGLAITKSLIEAHDGKIYVESKLNEGTIFTIELPDIQSSSIK